MDLRAASAARAVVRSVCVAWDVPHLVDVAGACVSELAANAVKHARWPADRRERTLWLRVWVAEPFMVVEVHDPDRRLPVVGCGIDWGAFEDQGSGVDALPVSGLGLFTVVERLRAVGGMFGAVPLVEGGKSVFFAVPVTALACGGGGSR
ncbi:MAG: ATP-binding protein [Sciscionella sp.]